MSPQNKDQTSQVNLEPAESLVEKKVNATTDVSVDTATFKEIKQPIQYQSEIKEETIFEKFEHNHSNEKPVLRSNILATIDPRFLKDDIANSLTTNRYSQTEISFAEVEN